MNPGAPVRYLLRAGAVCYVTVLVAVPVALILWRSLSPGLHVFVVSVTTPHALAALWLSVQVLAIVVPLNVVFGVVTALMLARNDFRGKRLMQAVIDLPFAVSPIVAGTALLMLWGSGILGFPGIVLATIFATAPFVIREVDSVLTESGADQERAAATLGASRRQAFWHITIPTIRASVLYGIVLTVARALGEYGAVVMVSPNLPGVSQTLTMLVSGRQDRGDSYGAFAMATVLMALAATVLMIQLAFEARRAKAPR